MPNWVENHLMMKGDKKIIKELYERFRTDEADEYSGEYGIDFNKILPMPESLNIESGSKSSKSHEIYNKFMGQEGLPDPDESPEEFAEAEEKYFQELEKKQARCWEDMKSSHRSVIASGEKTWKEWLNDFTATMKSDAPFPLYTEVVEYARLFDGHEPTEEEINNLFDSFRKTHREYWDMGRTVYNNVMKYGAPTWYEWRIDNWGCKWEPNTCRFDERSSTWSFQTPWAVPLPIIHKLAEMYPNIEFEIQYADEDLGYNCGEFHLDCGEDEFTERVFHTQEDKDRFACDVWGYDYDEMVAERYGDSD